MKEISLTTTYVGVELSHEAGEVAVLEVLRQDRLGKFLALEIGTPSGLAKAGADRMSPPGGGAHL